MKKLLIIFTLCTLASAAFANTPNDAGVTVGNWISWSDDSPVYNLADDNGFTTNIPGAGDGYVGEVGFMGTADGWLFNPNESVSVTVTEDFSADQIPSFDGNLYVMLSGVENMYYSDYGPMYLAPYNGPGEYILELSNDFGYEEGTQLRDISFGIADFDSDGFYNDALMIPEGKTFTVRFNPPQQETVVPEPMAAVYGLLGFGSLLGMKKRIKK